MNVIIYILLGIIAIIIFLVFFTNPMDEDGKSFNPNIFPFEIKDEENPNNKEGKDK